MVTIIGYDKRQSKEGREFFTLTIQGDAEIVQSQNGNLYMTARKTSIPSTFDEEGCAVLLGRELPGKIEKMECEPYEYENKETGETIVLSHTYVYISEKMQEKQKAFMNEFVPVSQDEQSPFEVGENVPLEIV